MGRTKYRAVMGYTISIKASMPARVIEVEILVRSIIISV